MITNREQQLIDFVKEYGASSSKELFDEFSENYSYATLKRTLSKLVAEKYFSTTGKGKSTKYNLSPVFEVLQPIDMEDYFKNEIDERRIRKDFNFSVITDVLSSHSIFSSSELLKLNQLQEVFKKNISLLTESEYLKEFERLAIDLSWKSSQIEGNTYSLLETEKLLKEKETAKGKTKNEAVMLLNHKEAIDFIVANPTYINPLSVSKIEDIHSILTKELEIERNVRKKRVGISGTNYRPLDNQFQLKEALQYACDTINKKDNVFEKALLTLVFLSYIQPFMDGNKRTERIVSNAILMNAKYCPLSYRTVDSIEYKKAMLLFYEQNNISNIKDIFIHQFEFAAQTYF